MSDEEEKKEPITLKMIEAQTITQSEFHEILDQTFRAGRIFQVGYYDAFNKKPKKTKEDLKRAMDGNVDLDVVDLEEVYSQGYSEGYVARSLYDLPLTCPLC